MYVHTQYVVAMGITQHEFAHRKHYIFTLDVLQQDERGQAISNVQSC